MASPAPLEIVHAYRHLYRGLLHAIQFSKPSRYIARDQLRATFRRGGPHSFDRQRISNTLKFLEGATRERGLEHRILKNLLHVAFWKADALKRDMPSRHAPLAAHLQASASKHFEMTITMLNESMGLCLR